MWGGEKERETGKDIESKNWGLHVCVKIPCEYPFSFLLPGLVH